MGRAEEKCRRPRKRQKNHSLAAGHCGLMSLIMEKYIKCHDRIAMYFLGQEKPFLSSSLISAQLNTRTRLSLGFETNQLQRVNRVSQGHLPKQHLVNSGQKEKERKKKKKKKKSSLFPFLICIRFAWRP